MAKKKKKKKKAATAKGLKINKKIVKAMKASFPPQRKAATKKKSKRKTAFIEPAPEMIKGRFCIVNEAGHLLQVNDIGETVFAQSTDKFPISDLIIFDDKKEAAAIAIEIGSVVPLSKYAAVHHRIDVETFKLSRCIAWLDTNPDSLKAAVRATRTYFANIVRALEQEKRAAEKDINATRKARLKELAKAKKENDVWENGVRVDLEDMEDQIEDAENSLKHFNNTVF